MSVRAVLAVWSLALIAAGGGVALILSSDRPRPVANAAVVVLIGLAFVGSGLLARARRPENRTGLLLLLVGFSWLVGALGASGDSLLFTIGYAESALVAAFFVHLVVAFPSGRLETRWERRVVASMYAVALVLQPIWMLFDDLHGLRCDECPANAFLVDRNETLATVLGVPTLAVILGVLLAVVAILIQRWRAASAPLRRVLAPVYVSSGATIVVLVIQNAVAPFSSFGADVLDFLTVLALFTVPLAFLGGLMRTRLKRTAVADLMTKLAEPPGPGGLRHALARALGDPSLELAYWVGDGSYVDPDGHPIALPDDGGTRVATSVERSGRPVAAIVHDASLRDQPELVDAVVAAAGLALENERLQAELRARLEELRASRLRLVETADVERRRLERNLHDGAQQRLVALSLTLALDRRAFESDPAVVELVERTRSELADALAELRELARGIHPPLLTDRGLKPALEALADRAMLPVELAGLPDDRLPAGVEAAAYYLVAEALTNVAKYAQASKASVRVERVNGSVTVEVSDDGIGGADVGRGSGLRGLADRVEALDGHLDVDSPPGAGTRLRAEIPCEHAAGL